MPTPITTPKVTTQNTPNADRLIESLRSTGYSNEAAISDLVDNGLDAGAKNINITITADHVIIDDNGSGMSYDTLDQAMRLGSRIDHVAGDLGKFGLGLITASISLGRRLEVTTSDGEETWTSAQDLDEIADAQEFVRTDTKVNETLPIGTIVTITKIDRLPANVEALATRLRKSLGQTYRHYLWSGYDITVNGQKVDPIDPLWTDHSETLQYSDEIFDLAGHKVRIKMVLLPRLTEGLAREQKINLSNQGIYVIRNSREIMAGQTFGLWSREFKNNRVRAEVQFGDELDDVMGVDFSKQGIKPTLPALELMRTVINAQRTHLRNVAEKQTAMTKEGAPDHTETEQVINSKQKLLMLPKAEKEKRELDGKIVEPAPETKDDAKTPRVRKPKNLQKPTTNANRVHIGEGSHGVGGPLFYPYLKGQTVVVEWNYDHPFYQGMVLRHKDDKDILAALNFLVYSLGTAELRVQNEDEPMTYEIIENLRSIFSGNLRALLK